MPGPRLLTRQAPLVHPRPSLETLRFPTILGQGDTDLSRVDLGVCDGRLSAQDGSLMSMARMEGSFGPDRVARVLRLESGGGRARLVVGYHGESNCVARHQTG